MRAASGSSPKGSGLVETSGDSTTSGSEFLLLSAGDSGLETSLVPSSGLCSGSSFGSPCDPSSVSASGLTSVSSSMAEPVVNLILYGSLFGTLTGGSSVVVISSQLSLEMAFVPFSSS